MFEKIHSETDSYFLKLSKVVLEASFLLRFRLVLTSFNNVMVPCVKIFAHKGVERTLPQIGSLVKLHNLNNASLSMESASSSFLRHNAWRLLFCAMISIIVSPTRDSERLAFLFANAIYLKPTM